LASQIANARIIGKAYPLNSLEAVSERQRMYGSFAESGGLLSFGNHTADQFWRAAARRLAGDFDLSATPAARASLIYISTPIYLR
jgi:hypothetical protein